MDILLKEGFLVNVMPGDKRGPFCEMNECILTKSQEERLEVLKRTRELIEKLHKSYNSNDSNSLIKLTDNFTDFCLSQKNYRSRAKKSSEQELITRLPVIPPINAVSVPEISKSVVAAEIMEKLTPSKESRLWCDLRYGLEGQPALSDMFIVSKGSRKIYTTPEDLKLILTGRKQNNWKCGEVGAITFIETKNGIMSARNAIKNNLGGEVICVAK